MTRLSEAQRARVLKRWNAQEEKEKSKSVQDSATRKKLLSKLIAYLQGDGSVSKRCDKSGKWHYEISFYPDNENVAKIFSQVYSALYGRSPSIKNLGNYFRVRASSHYFAYQDLSSITTFRSLNWSVPFNILDTRENKKEWLKAFFDCEAYVGKREITVQSVNERGLCSVADVLKEFGIVSRMYRYTRKEKTWNENFILRIGKEEDRRSFLNNVGFNHPEKQKMLEKYLAGVA